MTWFSVIKLEPFIYIQHVCITHACVLYIIIIERKNDYDDASIFHFFFNQYSIDSTQSNIEIEGKRERNISWFFSFFLSFFTTSICNNPIAILQLLILIFSVFFGFFHFITVGKTFFFLNNKPKKKKNQTKKS